MYFYFRDNTGKTAHCPVMLNLANYDTSAIDKLVVDDEHDALTTSMT